VWTATADALAPLGIGAGGGPNTLLATVLEFWEDGAGGTGTHVVVRFQLIDPWRRERWNAVVAAGSGEPGHLSPLAAPATPAAGAPGPSSDGAAVNVFTYALAELAARARVQFATPAFQQLLAP
jgi:hypothetical protein